MPVIPSTYTYDLDSTFSRSYAGMSQLGAGYAKKKKRKNNRNQRTLKKKKRSRRLRRSKRRTLRGNKNSTKKRR